MGCLFVTTPQPLLLWQHWVYMLSLSSCLQLARQNEKLEMQTQYCHRTSSFLTVPSAHQLLEYCSIGCSCRMHLVCAAPTLRQHQEVGTCTDQNIEVKVIYTQLS